MLHSLTAAWQKRPGLCPVCGLWCEGWACEPCLERFASPTLRCHHCACSWGGGVCPACAQQPALEHCQAAIDYAYPWDGLIGRWKFQGDLGLTRGWHALLAGLAVDLSNVDGVVPIPLSASKLAHRGYNQSWELAKGLLKDTPSSKAWPQCLERLVDVPDQHGLSAKDRRTHIQGVFGVHPQHSERLHNARVLLVDDVMTTGATLQEAARTLLAGGAQSVRAVVLARTPPH